MVVAVYIKLEMLVSDGEGGDTALASGEVHPITNDDNRIKQTMDVNNFLEFIFA